MKQGNEDIVLASHTTCPTGDGSIDGCGQATRADVSEWKPGRAEYLIVVTLTILSLVVALDTTILVSALSTIATELGGRTTDIFWLGSSFLLTSTIFQPVIVALSDDLGRGPLLLGSVIFFTLGSLIACLATSMTTLLGGRSIQGVGGGGILALNNALLTDIIPLRQRPMYMAITQGAWALGTILGPLLGGLFAQHATWRWVFYINFPFCAAGLVLVPLTVRLKRRQYHDPRSAVTPSSKSEPTREVSAARDEEPLTQPTLAARLAHIDWLGIGIFTPSISALLIGVTWGGSQFPWDAWQTLLPIVLGAVGLAGTLAWEVFGASRPFIPLSLFGSRSGAAAYVCALFMGILVCSQMYCLPIYLQDVKGYGPTTTGASLMPITGAMIPTSIVVGGVIRRTGRFRWALWSGWAMTTLAAGLLILLKPDTQVYAWVLIFVADGFGLGLILMSLNFATQALAEGGDGDVGYAAVMYTFARTAGLCIGVAVGGTVFQNTLPTHLAAKGLPTGLATDIEALYIEALSSPQRPAFAEAISQSIGNIAEFMAGIGAAGLLLSLLIRSSSADVRFKPTHVIETKRASA